MSAGSPRLVRGLDAVLIAAAVVIAAVAWARWVVGGVPALNAAIIDSAAALIVCVLAVGLTLLVDDARPAVSMTPVLFGVTLAVCASGLVHAAGEILLAPWATLVLAIPMLFWSRGIHFASRAAVVVIAGQVLVLTQDELQTFAPDYAGIAGGLAAYGLVALALLSLLRAVHAEGGVRLTARTVLYPLAGLVYGVCLFLVLLLLHHRNRDAVAILGSSALVALLVAVVWEAQHIRALRRLSAGLMEAARQSPWPAETMDDILIRLVRDGIRAETVSLEREPGDAATITEPVAPGLYLVARRSPGDVRFSAGDRRLVAGLAALGRASHIRAERESALFNQAVTDELTGLWEYEHWRSFAEDQSRNRQPDELVGVVFFDFDHFKQLNEDYGHLHADDVLAEVGSRLRVASRHWRFTRFGGDEVVGLIREVRDESELDKVCEQIERIVAEPVSTGRYTIVPTVTVGRVLSYDRADRLPWLVARADDDLRRRKHARPVLSGTPTSTELVQGLLAGALEVAFQPVVDTATGGTIGWEALLRGTIGHHGAVGSPQLVEAARDLDALDVVTRKVSEIAMTTAEQASRILQRRQTISVNVEAEQLRWTSDLVAWLGRQGERSAAQLVLEITEREEAADWSEEQYDVIEELARRGVPCALDDVGAGYSRLRPLARRAWHWVKLDRDFIATGPRSLVILRGYVDAFQELGQPLVLEGVAEPGHLELARSLKIEYCQGNLFGAPCNGRELLDGLGTPAKQ